MEEDKGKEKKRREKSDLRFSAEKDKPDPIVNIPDLLLETDRRVKYATDIEVTKEVNKNSE